MLQAMLHGLGIRKIPDPQHSFKQVTTDAFLAPLGKSYGSYTLDSNSLVALEVTENLPNLSGALKNVQLDFYLERYTTTNGDFIVATCDPSFPGNLGTPIVPLAYIDAIRGRKYITYYRNNVWTEWKEIGTASLVTYEAFIEDDPVTIVLDPQTVRNYLVHLEPGSVATFDIVNFDTSSYQIEIDINPTGASYTLNWPADLEWTNTTRTPPEAIQIDERLNVLIRKSSDGIILATYLIYKAS
jgi:hypothetical protein